MPYVLRHHSRLLADVASSVGGLNLHPVPVGGRWRVNSTKHERHVRAVCLETWPHDGSLRPRRPYGGAHCRRPANRQGQRATRRCADRSGRVGAAPWWPVMKDAQPSLRAGRPLTSDQEPWFVMAVMGAVGRLGTSATGACIATPNRCARRRGRSDRSQHVTQDRVVMVGTSGEHEQVPHAVCVGKAGVERIEDDSNGVEQAARHEPGETGRPQRV